LPPSRSGALRRAAVIPQIENPSPRERRSRNIAVLTKRLELWR
jgi:hypothetical protein